MDAHDETGGNLLDREALEGGYGLLEELPFCPAGGTGGNMAFEASRQFKGNFVINKIGELVLTVGAIHKNFTGLISLIPLACIAVMTAGDFFCSSLKLRVEAF
jgi:hypothetical protein